MLYLFQADWVRENGEENLRFAVQITADWGFRSRQDLYTFQVHRVVCPYFGHTALTSSFTKNKFSQVKNKCQVWNCFSFWMVICYFRSRFKHFVDAYTLSHMCKKLAIQLPVIYFWERNLGFWERSLVCQERNLGFWEPNLGCQECNLCFR